MMKKSNIKISRKASPSCALNKANIIIVAQKRSQTNLASRWEGVRLPQASGKSPDFPEVPRTSPEVFGDFPGSSPTVELNSNPEVPRKFPKLPRKFPKLPWKFPDFPGGQPLSLGSLTPSPDSQNLSLKRSQRYLVMESGISGE